MGAIKDLVDLTSDLLKSVKERKVAEELRHIQSMIGDIQSEQAELNEQRIGLMSENADLKQKITSLEQEIAELKSPGQQEQGDLGE